MKCRHLLAAVGAALLASLPLAAAEKTDVVVLKNGDRITGEVKKLERGKLKVKTDSMGTIYIEWLDVEQVRSSQHLELEMQDGQKFFGTLGVAPEETKLEVRGEESTVAVEHPSVVRITPIEEGFWKKLDGSFNLGLNLARANRSREISFSTTVNSRTRKFLRSFSLAANLDEQEVEGEGDLKATSSTTRSSLGFSVERFLKARRLLLGFAQIQQNEELDLDFRALAGVGFGRYLIQNNKTILSFLGGLDVNREQATDGSANESVEAVGALNYSMFLFNDPKTNIDMTLLIFPSLTTSGRVRVEFDAQISREIFKDFFLSLSLYDSFDGEPLLEGSSTNDWRVDTSLGWTF